MRKTLFDALNGPKEEYAQLSRIGSIRVNEEQVTYKIDSVFHMTEHTTMN